MIESISHLTFIVKDVKRSADLFRTVFDAKEVYDSAERIFSLAYEKFFLIGGTWIAIMEGDPLSERTYNHVAFKVKAIHTHRSFYKSFTNSRPLA